MNATWDETTIHLLEAARAGDSRASNQLLGRYRDRLLQIVSLLMGRRRSRLLEDEEDIVQDTLLKAFLNLGSFTPRSDGALLRWLAKMAENNLYDALRKERTQKRGGGRVVSRSDASSAFLARSVLGGEVASPSKVAEARELGEQVEVFVCGLDDRERRLFVMRCLCSVSYEEIAGELGLKGAATARSLYSRLMTRLLSELPDLPRA